MRPQPNLNGSLRPVFQTVYARQMKFVALLVPPAFTYKVSANFLRSLL